LRNIGNAGQQFLELAIHRLDLLIERRDLLSHGAHVLLAFGSVHALAPQFGDFGSLEIAARFEILNLTNGGAAFLVEFAETLDRRRVAARGQALRNAIEIVPEEREIVHFPSC